MVDLSFHSPTIYTWSLNGTEFSSLSNPDQITIDTTMDNRICLIVSNEHGADTLCKTIESRLPSATIDLLALDIQVYPNPSSDIFYISLDSYQNIKGNIKVSDVNGRLILSKILEDQITILDLSNMASGIYFINILDDNGRNLHYGKVIKI